jgi:hypothetical protein
MATKALFQAFDDGRIIAKHPAPFNPFVHSQKSDESSPGAVLMFNNDEEGGGWRSGLRGLG